MKGRHENIEAQRERGRLRGLANRTHGMTKTPEHRAWRLMWQRCENQKDDHFPDYGGRGIRVCDRWRSFAKFFMDMGKKPSSAHTIDRKNVDGNYEPGNCRWATVLEQNQNKRTTRRLTFRGKTQCVTAWEKELGLPRNLVGTRIRAGWTQERALTTPSRRPA